MSCAPHLSAYPSSLSYNVLDEAQPFKKMENELMLTFSSPSLRLHNLPPPNSPAPFVPENNSNLFSPYNQDASAVNAAHNGTFNSPEDLATHYGIPQHLPPVPRTTCVADDDDLSELTALKSNYLSMLSNNHNLSDSYQRMPSFSESPLLVDNALLSPGQVSMQGFSGDSSASLPEDNTDFGTATCTASPYVNRYLTSPLGTPYDTPYEDFATSPNDDTPYHEFLTTPLIHDESDPIIFCGPSDGGSLLFPEMPLTEPGLGETKADVPKMPDMDKMYTMSPDAPFIDSTDSPSFTSTNMPSATSTRHRVNSVTGTRKNITPESLIPLDAPTQRRNYVFPSVTSRKDVPTTFSRKRPRSQLLAEGEEDELDPQESLAPNATDRERIEWKRRQNTLAARKSRKRKLEHQRYLESRVVNLEQEKEMWRTRAMTLQGTLRENGIACADFPEDQ